MSTLHDRVTELLATPSLEGLEYALRHPETWPMGFWWDYSDCTCCAMGVAMSLWAPHSDVRWPDEYLRAVAKMLEIRSNRAREVFFDLDGTLGIRRSTITPIHVADAIADYLAAHPIAAVPGGDA